MSKYFQKRRFGAVHQMSYKTEHFFFFFNTVLQMFKEQNVQVGR